MPQEIKMDNKTFTITLIAAVAGLIIAAAIFAFASGVNVRVWNLDRDWDWNRNPIIRPDRDRDRDDSVDDGRRQPIIPRPFRGDDVKEIQAD